MLAVITIYRVFAYYFINFMLFLNFSPVIRADFFYEKQ